MVTPTQNTLPSRGCPATNGSTYTATNNPFPTDASQIPNPSLKFEILCDAGYREVAQGSSALKDIQLIANVSSLNDCLDICALYDFLMEPESFPGRACTGVLWSFDNTLNSNPTNVCWLKNNLTLESSSLSHLGYDSGVLLLDN